MMKSISDGRRAAITLSILALLPVMLLLTTGIANAAEVSGQVQGGDGQPAPGVKVALHVYKVDVPVTTSIAGEFGKTASYDREDSLATEAVETMTNKAGRFAFTGVDPGMYILMVARRKSGDDSRFVEEFRPLPLTIGAEGLDLGALRLDRRGAYVTGTVRLGGKPAAGVMIRRWSAGLGPMQGTYLTDSNGKFTVYVYRVPRKGSTITLSANLPGVATAARRVDSPAPWSEAHADFDLSRERYGNVYGHTREPSDDKSELPESARPVEFIYVCAPGKGTETAANEPLIAQDGTFNVAVPVGEWDVQLVRPGHASQVKRVKVADGGRHHVSFDEPSETEIAGTVRFTLGDREIPYPLARTFVGPIAVRLIDDRTASAVVEDYVADGEEFALRAPAGRYRVEVHSCAVTPYGPAMLDRLATGSAFKADGGATSVPEILVDLEPRLEEQVAHGMESGPLSPAATRASMNWLAADLVTRADADPELAEAAKAIRETIESLLAEAAQ